MALFAEDSESERNVMKNKVYDFMNTKVKITKNMATDRIGERPRLTIKIIKYSKYSDI